MSGWRPRLAIPSRKELSVRWRQVRTDVSLWFEKRSHRAGAEAGGARAAFIVGTQRSGTDMMLWALDKSLDVDRYDENERAAFVDCRIRPLEVRRRLVERSRARRVIFKPVCDSHRARILLDEHAESRAIWGYRDYRDVSNSAVQRWGEMNLEWMREIAAGRGDWGRRQWNRELITPERQARIREWCDDALTAHGAAAIFWWLVNETFFDQGLDRDARVLISNYERLVADAPAGFRRLCAFLSVSYREKVSDGIFQSSVKKRAKSPISAAIERACEEMMSRLDAVESGGAKGGGSVGSGTGGVQDSVEPGEQAP